MADQDEWSIEKLRNDGHRPKALGMHIYSGSWTAGFAKHFDVVGQWEELDAATATARTNLAKLNVPHVLSPEGPEGWPFHELPEDLELLFANPPCAVWSQAGKHLGLDDPRLQYTRNSMESGLRVEPTFFALESVPGALTKGREVYDGYAQEFLKRGYGVTYFLSNALLHGAPQYRERFHFLAHKYELNLQEPRLDFGDVATVRRAIGDLADNGVPAGETPVLPNHILYPNGGFNEGQRRVLPYLVSGPGRWDAAYRAALADGRTAGELGKARMITRRLRWDTPCEVLLDLKAFVHPDQERVLTMREGARLCAYPDWFEFSPRAHHSELSQAVLPVIGDFLGRTFTRALDDPRPVGQRGIIEVVDFRPLAARFRPSKFEQNRGY